jgi:1-aminocyclopropane-1-carboxylate deaminase/D-cysteine desulfhydrase-like pyridoxal-dependent ACC family enzyme
LFDYPLQSRVHRLKSFDTESCVCWVKRDDELGFGITGSKIRKYRSLVPFLVNGRFEEIALIGGANSNHIVGLSQLLREERLPFRLFLRGEASQPLVGNSLLTSMIAGPSAIRWISRSDWPQVYSLAQDEMKGRNAFVVPEGAFCEPALSGALTLADDIRRNEKTVRFSFPHVFVEAGTGLTAMALLQGLTPRHHIHIILLADDEEAFLGRMSDLDILVQAPFTLHRPTVARSFGAVNSKVLETIRTLAYTEGILTDPIYSAKLFMTAQEIIATQNLEGQALVVHSGGGLALSGFQDQLARR